MNIEAIVKNNLCTGCGVCISEDKSHQAKMVWNNEGFLIPELSYNSTQDEMIKVCPFGIKQKNEDELGEIFLKKPEIYYDEKIGYYYGLYAGYSNQFRETSSSGGIATFIFQKLLEQKVVDHLFIVKELEGGYAYQFFSDIKAITQISKTRYTPVTLEKLFLELGALDGKVAVVGVACFVKAIRLKQLVDPILKEKIAFIVGIICGGLKSRYYTDYLAQEAGCQVEYSHAQYRVKNKKSYALDYKFTCIEKPSKKIHMVEMKTLGDMWGTGLFKSNACDFCDDVLTELADISLGDAWIDPYDKQGLGNNIIITRSTISEKIIHEGELAHLLKIESLSRENIIKSQNGSFNHRRNGLLYRVKNAEHREKVVPNKRRQYLKKQNIFFNLVQGCRLDTRKNSLEIWVKTRNIILFNMKMHPYFKRLTIFTIFNHKYTRLVQKFKQVINK
ncbi:Coenzyme F420 hydrogenase/dehydrogenase, beta subunit C-terminal domain [Acinetobacter sp. ANC 5383]